MKRLILIFALIPIMANAGTLVVTWTNPSRDQDSTSCLCTEFFDGDPSICIFDGAPLKDLRGVKIWGLRFTQPRDTLYFGEKPTTVPGARDSVALAIDDGISGELLFRTVDASGNVSCLPTHLVFSMPALPAPAPPPAGSGPGLKGDYYRGAGAAAFSSLIATRVDSTVYFSWSSGSPMAGVPADSFTVRWTGYVNVPTADVWTFYVSSDDGIRFWIDGQLVQDYWGPRVAETSNSVSLSKGAHAVRLEFEEIGGDAFCRLLWSGPGTTKRAVPGSALSH